MGIIARQSIKASIVALVGVAIGAFIRLFLYTKFLSTSEIGILETIIKLGLLMIPFFVIGSPQVITRYFGRFKKSSHNDGLLFTYSSLLAFVLLPIASLAYLLNRDYIFSLYTEAPELAKYYWLPLIVSITFGGFAFLKSISVVHLRITVPAFLSGVVDRSFVLLLLVLYGVFQVIDIDQFLYLNIVVFFVVPFLLMIAYLIWVIKPKFSRTSLGESFNILKQTGAYNTYLIFGTLSGVIISAIDVNMISGQLGTHLAGVYTIAFFMGTVIDVPRRSLTSIIYPILNKAVVNKDVVKYKSLYQKASVNQFLVGAFMFLIIWINIDDIFTIIPNGEEFRAGKLVVLFIGLSKVVDMLMGVNRQIIELSSYYRLNLLVNIILSILVIVLNMIFIPLESEIFGGINGVAFASLLALLICNLLSFTIVLLMEKIQPFTLDHIKIIGVIILSFVICYFISIENPILGILVNSLCVATCFLSLTLMFNISEDFTSLYHNLIEKVFKK
ncbi:MAG: hypothetical protein CMP57_02570 [Flavobacteriales bacterium]|nr:hypothetical protein [Flavobacteriales bacterium]